MRAFYALLAVGGVLLSAYGCDGSTESLNPVTTSSGSAGPSGGAGGANTASGGGGGADQGGASSGGGGAASGSGGANAGGSGGAASGGASAGGSSGTSTGGGGGGPPPPECTTQNDTCPAGKYCKAPGCGAGQCKNKPAEGMMSNDEDLVCGCDGVTYWNAHFAAHSGVSVAMAGACPGGSGTPCSVSEPCPGGLTCNVEVAGVGDCSPLATGECWGIPSECPTNGPKGKACTDGSCQFQCALIASQHSWYDDGMCP